MKKHLEKLLDEYAKLADSQVFLIGSGSAVLALFLAYIINYELGLHATAQASAPVQDILLSSIPLIDTSAIHAGAVHILVATILPILFLLPRYFPFALLSLSLLVLVRSFFINMTNLGPYPDAIEVTNSTITFGGDLFFSGHVAIPFLFAIIFWDYFFVRILFLSCSILFGISSLAGHMHYSIDVFAAPFIAYGVFKIATKLLPDVWALTQLPPRHHNQ